MMQHHSHIANKPMSFEIQVFFSHFFHILFAFYNNFFFISLDRQTYQLRPCPLYLHIEKSIYKAMLRPTSGISLILLTKSGMGLRFLTNIRHFIHPPPSAQLVMYPIGDRNLHLVSCLFPHMDMLSSLVHSTLLTMVYPVYEKVLDYRDHHVTCLRTFIYLQYVFPARTSQCCPYH